LDHLPFIDEHSRRIAAPADAVWAALLAVVRRETATVIGSGAHAVVTRRLLQKVARVVPGIP
jgi:hypothetical protein